MKPEVKWTLIAGIICMLGAPCAGFIWTVIGMVGDFNTLGHSGISDPNLLAAHIGTTLVATMVGLVVGMLGLAILIVATILHFTMKSPPAPAPNP